MNYLKHIILLALLPVLLFADEGMWPITEIEKIDLASKGLELPIEQLYNPDGISLVNAIVRLSGCTASFVSSQGLILTNHHCAFGAVQRASSSENDYLTDGFLAGNKTEELHAPGYTANIVESYRDVSDEILSVVNEGMDSEERNKAIEKKMKEVILAAEKAFPGKRAEVSEMFIGKSYLLFIYMQLRDIRMVYVPPIAVGEFGGEEDNWVWPRHTGDFSFFRAYVASDGSPADFSPENIAYQPKIHFQVAPQGVNEEDFVFIMGYPGGTYRHRTSYFMAFEENIRMPFLADLYETSIEIMDRFSDADPDAAIRLASRIKGLSNRMKNYRGKLTGMKRLDLVNQRKISEQELQSYIHGDPERQKRYGTVLQQIETLYTERGTQEQRDLLFSNFISSSTPLKNATTVFRAAENKIKPDIERESSFMDRNIERTKRYTYLSEKSYYPRAEKEILSGLLKGIDALPADQRIEPIDTYILSQGVAAYLDQLYSDSKFSDSEFLASAFELEMDKLTAISDPALILVMALDPERKDKEKRDDQYEGALNRLHAQLIDIKKEFYSNQFIPDANSTFRLTYGYIRGYNPRDAVYNSPITTFRGVVEKTTGVDPFITPTGLINLYKQKNFGQFSHPVLKNVPVALLYNTDTTGGNSGSPVLNSKGQLVGVNFDRAWEATINDYAWSEDYSRSIAVDIRYVLWVTQKFSGADYLLTEMNVPLE